MSRTTANLGTSRDALISQKLRKALSSFDKSIMAIEDGRIRGPRLRSAQPHREMKKMDYDKYQRGKRRLIYDNII